MLTIRKFRQTDHDYETAVQIHNSIWREEPVTVFEWKRRDQRRASKLRWGRFFAEVDGQAVGIGIYNHLSWLYHPRKFWINIDVLPQYRRQGIGSSLYQQILAALAPLDPITIYSDTTENNPDGLRFLQRLGFAEVLREWEYRLDPSLVNLAEWSHYEAQAAANGIGIYSLTELAGDADRDRKLYELAWRLEQDVPNNGAPLAKPNFTEWMQIWKRTNLLPDGWFVAVDGAEYVGMSSLWTAQALPGVLNIGITGVLPTHRRRGIALALKVRGIRYAQERGATEIRTFNAVENVGMLAINERMGFVRQPAYMEFEKKLKAE